MSRWVNMGQHVLSESPTRKQPRFWRSCFMSTCFIRILLLIRSFQSSIRCQRQKKDLRHLPSAIYNNTFPSLSFSWAVIAPPLLQLQGTTWLGTGQWEVREHDRLIFQVTVWKIKNGFLTFFSLFLFLFARKCQQLQLPPWTRWGSCMWMISQPIC